MKRLFKISTLLCFLIFSSFEVVYAQNVSQNTKTFSRINFFNNLATAANLTLLNQQSDPNGIKIRLWIPFTHNLGAYLLDIQLDKDSSNIQWFVAWADWDNKDKKDNRAERWPCKTKVNRVRIDEETYAACKLKKATESEIRHIKKVLEESDIYKLSKIPVEKRVQLDGSSLHIELLDNSGYYFQSFLNYHLNNHPMKKEMNNIQELVFSWSDDIKE